MPDFSVDALATGTITKDDPQFNLPEFTWKSVEMSSAYLEKGVTYAIVVTAFGSNADYAWYTKYNANGYDDGWLLYIPAGDDNLVGGGLDLSFRVNLIPEPATLLLLSLGSLVLGKYKRTSSD